MPEKTDREHRDVCANIKREIERQAEDRNKLRRKVGLVDIPATRDGDAPPPPPPPEPEPKQQGGGAAAALIFISMLAIFTIQRVWAGR